MNPPLLPPPTASYYNPSVPEESDRNYLTLPNALTALRLLLLPVFLWLLISAASHASHETRRWAAIAVIAVMAGTDSLDGYLARRLDQTSRLGAMLDPLADKLMLASSLIVLCIPSLAGGRVAIPWPVVLGTYLKEIGVLIGALVIISRVGQVQIHASRAGKISTFIQLALVLATLLSPECMELSARFAGTMLWCLWMATIIATALAAADYARAGARQLRAASTEHEAEASS
jgi:CDP-diacylglycerol--glycerol-3-phosphate 3-phosphatidyltransferase